MERTPDGKYAFTAEEFITLSLAVAERCRSKYRDYKRATEYGYDGTYSHEEYTKACALYRELFGREFSPCELE